MNTPASTLRRRSQVFVEIPPSPLHSARALADNPSHQQQEATPLKTVAINVNKQSTPSSSHLKRKSLDAPLDMSRSGADAQPPKPKKAKVENASDAPKSITKSVVDKDGASVIVYRCHQCSRQKEVSSLAMCTFIRSGAKRCNLKYCKACLQNRYKEDITTIKSHAVECSSLAEDQGYRYQCPRCRDMCNCRTCRKAKGLPPVGPIGSGTAQTNHGSRPTKNNAVQYKNAPQAKRKLHGLKLKLHVLVPKASYKIVVPKAPTKSRVPRPKLLAPPRPLPKPVWTAMSMSYPLTYDGVMERMNIREFLLRFSHLTEIARGYLEELEDLVTSDSWDAANNDDANEEGDSSYLVGWISEAALKAILVGLLTIISKDADFQGNKDIISAMSTANQQIRNSGANLVKMWSALNTLREGTSLNIPDPFPPPANASLRSTRSSGDASSSTVVLSTAQLVPAVAVLVEAALQTEAIRDDFERGVTQTKDIARAVRELAAAENARWKDVKAAELKAAKTGKEAKTEKVPKGEVNAEGSSKDAYKKAAKSAHEDVVASLDHVHEVAAAECIARFGPLGRDTEGRVYYALTPGVIEREAAVNLLEGRKGDVKFNRRRAVVEEEERKRLKHWSWFVAVWGRKPEDAKVATAEAGEVVEDKDRQSDEDLREQWWGFWESKEIAALAEWLAMKHDLDLNAKRAAKSPDETSVLDAEGSKRDDDKAALGRPSNVSLTASTSRAPTFAMLNNSDESDDPDGSDSSADLDVQQMRLDERGEPVPTKQDIRALVQGLKDYATLLEWRIKRATKMAKDDEKREVLDKGKGVEKNVPKIQAIPPARFYGK